MMMLISPFYDSHVVCTRAPPASISPPPRYVDLVFDLGSVAILRLLRLLRVCRVLHSFPALRAVVNSLLLACTNVLHLFFLIALVNFVVACVGMLLFRANDPHNFGTLIAALISVWMVETLDEWEGPYYSLSSRGPPFGRDSSCVCVSRRVAVVGR